MNAFVVTTCYLLGSVVSAVAEIREADEALSPKARIMWDESERFESLGIRVTVAAIEVSEQSPYFHHTVYWSKRSKESYVSLSPTPAGLNWFFEKSGVVLDAPQKREAFADLVATAFGYRPPIDRDDFSRIVATDGHLPDADQLKDLASLPGGDASLSFACRGADEFTFWRFDIAFDTPTRVSRLTITEIKPLDGNKPSEQGGAGQPATRSQSKSEGGDKPQPEAEGRAR